MKRIVTLSCAEKDRKILDKIPKKRFPKFKNLAIRHLTLEKKTEKKNFLIVCGFTLREREVQKKESQYGIFKEYLSRKEWLVIPESDAKVFGVLRMERRKYCKGKKYGKTFYGKIESVGCSIRIDGSIYTIDGKRKETLHFGKLPQDGSKRGFYNVVLSFLEKISEWERKVKVVEQKLFEI